MPPRRIVGPMNNLFAHSPKELTTDGFLAWYFTELNDDSVGDKRTYFFYKLGLCDNSNVEIKNINVSRQEKNTDLIVRYQENGVEKQALFENKTYTTTHSDQLRKYSTTFSDFSHYIYLKLGFINHSEKKEATSSGYAVIDVYTLHSALTGFRMKHCIVDQYIEFIETQYIQTLDNIQSNMIKNNNHELLSDAQAQQYILSKLHDSIDGMNPYLYFKFAANSGGAPWTQLDIAKRENAYGDEAEYLFWRIDKRAGKYYLRLNQYSYIESDHWPKKSENLEILRNLVTSMFIDTSIRLGKVANRGMYESERLFEN